MHGIQFPRVAHIRLTKHIFRLINKNTINSMASTKDVMNFCICLLIGFYWWEFVDLFYHLKCVDKILLSYGWFWLKRIDDMKLGERRKAIKYNGISDKRLQILLRSVRVLINIFPIWDCTAIKHPWPRLCTTHALDLLFGHCFWFLIICLFPF